MEWFMKTRRRFLLLAGSGSLALVVGGCKDSAKDSSPTVPTTPSPSAPLPPPPSPPPPSAPGPTVLPKGARSYAQKIVYPAGAMIQNGGSVYDITNPPLASLAKAKGDGVADDTAALIAAIDHILKLTDNGRPFTDEQVAKNPFGSYIIYLPNGIYRVSNTLTYSGPTRFPTAPGNAASNPKDKFDTFVGMKFIGETRDGAIIRLAPNAAGFGDANAPRAVMQFVRPDVSFNNYASDAHGCRNLTIDVTNNRGAVGIAYYAANSGIITNILIRADDNAGAIGIRAPIAVFSGYLQDITIEGFDYGIKCEGQPVASAPVLEYLSLVKQRIAGISIARTSVTIRNLAVSGGATAVELTGPSAQAIVLDSDLNGGSSANPAIRQVANSHLYLRNVTATGFAATVAEGTQTKLALGTAQEYSSLPTKYTRAGRKALNLPIKEAPVPFYDPDVTKWVKPAGLDQASVQAAFSSGKPIVYFPSNTEYVFGDVNVPASTKLIDGMGGQFSGRLVITENSTEPLFICDTRTLAIDNKSNRTVVLYSVLGGGALKNAIPGTEWYFCSIAAASLTNFKSATVYGRWVNFEGARTFEVQNCNWVQMGYKAERQDQNPCIVVTDASKFELLGGTVGVLITTTLLNIDATSQASAVMNSSHISYLNATTDSVIDAGGRNLPKTEFPSRNMEDKGITYFFDVRAVNT
jgi:hypothetical protein